MVLVDRLLDVCELDVREFDVRELDVCELDVCELEFLSSMFFCLPLSDRYFPAQSLRHKTILLFANSTFPRPFGYKPHLLIKIALNCS